MAREDNKLIRRRLANAYASSIISISLVLMLIGVAAFLIVNAGSVSDYIKENMQVSVIMKQGVSDEDAEVYGKSVQTLPYVRSARLVTRAEGEEELKAMLGEDFLSVFETSPVPVSLEITLHADYVAPDSLSMVSRMLAASPLVEEVECQRSLVEALNSNLARISMVLGVFILMMLSISYVLIANTVRLNVFARRFTVHTMKLVGASRSFIRRPFMRASILQGLASSVIALALLYAVFYALRNSFPQLFTMVTLTSLLIVAASVIFAGVVICMLSTFFVVNRLVSLDKNELYY